MQKQEDLKMSDLSISAISSNSASNTSKSGSASALSEDTQKKLKALGLDPTKYTSETQAQTAILEAQSKQEGPKQSGAPGMSSIQTEIQDLASKMGLPVGNNDKMSDILGVISNKIDDLKAAAGTDVTKLSAVSDYQSQYTAISNELAQMEAAKKMTGASALANYNKAALGLS